MVSRNCFRVVIILVIISISCPSPSKLKSCSENMRPQQVSSYHTINDMPRKNDLNTYMKSLSKIIRFSNSNKEDVDIQFAFGLFLIKVNVKTVLRQKSVCLPEYVLKWLREAVKETDELLEYFNYMVMQEKDPKKNPYIHIYSMFMNDTKWVGQIEKFSSTMEILLSRENLKQLKDDYNNWDDYVKRVTTYREGVPSIEQSDQCIASLAKNPVSFEPTPSCELKEFCYKILLNGSDYGYALSHRILLILLARLSRGCAVFSPAIDREMLLRFCSISYSEAEYIAMNNFKLLDLLMEKIAFCTLNGHSEFVHRSWMTELLRYQAPMGCFRSEIQEELVWRRRWTLEKHSYQQNILQGSCEGHLTATAAGALASAVRYILEKFYLKKCYFIDASRYT